MTGAAMKAIGRQRLVIEADDACLDGHFPGHPVIPGVVLLDRAIATFGFTTPIRIDQAKFLKPCVPGMQLDAELSRTMDAGELRIAHGEELMASARVRWSKGRMVDDV